MRSDKMSVVFFGGTDGFMAQQHLYGTDIGALGQQLDRERIPEAVRVRVDAGYFADPFYGPAQATRCGAQATAATPEVVHGVAVAREPAESLDGIGAQQHFERRAGLHDAQR